MAIGKTKEFLDDQYDKHRPRYFSLVFNTLFMLTFIGVAIYLTIEGYLEIWVAIIVCFLMLVFGASTWYTKLINRKRNQHIINSFKEETEIVIEEIKKQKKLIVHEIENVDDLVFTFEKTDKIINDEIIFDLKTRRFEGSSGLGFLLQIGITCAGLVVDSKNKKVLGIKGVAPSSVWIKKKVLMPQADKGIVYVDVKNIENLNSNTILKFYRSAETYYDYKTGVIVMGERKMNPIYDLIQVSSSLVLALYDKKLVSVFIQIQKELNI